MKVLFDTNIILDVLLDRGPFADDSSFLLAKVEQSEITGFVCATTITTIHYLATRALGANAASRHIDSNSRRSPNPLVYKEIVVSLS